MNNRRQKPSSNFSTFIKKAPIIKHLIIAAAIAVVAVILSSFLLIVLTRHGQVREVPNFSGMNIEEATKAGSPSSLQITINDSLYVPELAGGVILEQNPAPGAKVKSNRRIFVTINSFSQRKVEIPYVSGYSLRQAKNNLEVAGLTIEKLIYTNDIATNNVIEQRYDNKVITANSREKAPKGAGITLVVGRDKDDQWQQVPMVVGLTLSQAKSRLWEVGFNVGRIENTSEDITSTNIAKAKVIFQSPTGGHIETLGSQVDLRLSLNPEQIQSGVKQANAEYIKAEKERQEQLEAEQNNNTTDSEAQDIDTENTTQQNE